jgi:hypothetical protein
MRATSLLIPLFAHFSLFPDAVRAQFSSVRIQVIDVRQSDGVVIRMPRSRWILIDAGTNSQIAYALEKCPCNATLARSSPASFIRY